MRRSIKACELEMAQAPDYRTWREAACEHDRLTGMDDWKADDASPYYDYDLIRRRLSDLKTARECGDLNQIVFFLHEGLHGNLGNIANPFLYGVAKFGSKQLITEYIDEVCTCINAVCSGSPAQMPLSKKLDAFTRIGGAFGRSALMLSGGAILGLFHLGVIKAIWEERLLPSVISGSSAGSIVVSVLGTHSDDELEALYNPEYLFLEAFRTVGWRRMVRGRPLADSKQLELCLERNVKDMTFEEAYQYSGRQINIPVSPADPHQESRLLNALTAPNVLVRKASLASCAIPGIFPPVMLWAKNIHGDRVPYIPGRQWVDGTIKDDLPQRRLARLYGVNHTIVSQTNPHVVPFLSRKKIQPSLIEFVRKLAVSNVSNNVGTVLKYLRNSTHSPNLGLMFDKLYSVVSQPYRGDINIVPPRRASNIFKIFANPTPADVEEFVKTGERCTWPQIELIRNSTRISHEFENCTKRLRAQEAQQLAPLRLVQDNDTSSSSFAGNHD